jgi:hypothetical protein
MQAFYFFAIFGLLSAIIGGIIAVSNLTTQRLRIMLLNEAHEQFREANVMLNGQYIPNYLQSPPIPGAGTSTPAGPYVCGIEDIRQILNCSSGVPKDPWNHDVTGVVVRQMQAMATKNNLVFNVPVTGYALLSAGPDGIVQTTLPTNPTSIAQLTALTPAGDDILGVLTDQKGQQDNVGRIETAMSRIGQAATQNYQRQFSLIVKPNLASIYAAANFADITSDAAQNYWKTYVTQTSGTVVVNLTSGSNWTVPLNWPNDNNTIEALGGGGAGGYGGYFASGGGGGAYSSSKNVVLTPGAVVAYQVGAGGAALPSSPGGAGGDTWFSGTSLSNALVGAQGGAGGQIGSVVQPRSLGGQASSGRGNNLLKSGGGGGYGAYGGGGGGGAAGPLGNGGNGGDYSGGSSNGGGGGGGANGGGNGANDVMNACGGGNGGNGGLTGTGGGLSSQTVCSVGTNGGGGSGGWGGACPGGAGGVDNYYGTGIIGFGGGGGGGGYDPCNTSNPSGPGGSGRYGGAGNYGGGGGGGAPNTSGGVGGQGFIRITYTPQGDRVTFKKLLNPSNTLNTYAIGDDGDVATIQRTLGGGGNLTLMGSVSDSDPANNGINDILFLTISTTTTPWQQVTPNCTVSTPVNCMKVKGTI